ncbi:MAG TPA: superoxide dismutase family protein [Thermoanaerobaculia bacterium]
MKRMFTMLPALVFALACAHTKSGPMAMAMLTPISGSTAKGMVHFQELADGSVDVTADLQRVPPGVHGFHVHDKGDCSDNGNAAGGHFNPMNMQHAGPDAQSHHAGDFGNVTADANGEVHAQFNTRAITVGPGPLSVVGRSIVLHANPDDLTTQPSGNSGPRISCGIITAMAGEMHH